MSTVFSTERGPTDVAEAPAQAATTGRVDTDGKPHRLHPSVVLGHGYQKRSVTERYIHRNPEALRPAADAIAGSIAKAGGSCES